MKPFDCDLKHYEACLATRDFWDDCGHEWNYKTLDEKLVILGGFVQRGGSLKRVIKRYAEDRSEIYRSRIHWVIFRYIWRMIMGDEPMNNFNPMSSRIKYKHVIPGIIVLENTKYTHVGLCQTSISMMTPHLIRLSANIGVPIPTNLLLFIGTKQNAGNVRIACFKTQ